MISCVNKIPNNRRNAKNRKGAMMILIAIMLVGFLVAVAFSVDMAYMHLTRTELRSATDAAAKAASVELSQSGEVDSAIAFGQEIARNNSVAGDGLLLSSTDFTFGQVKLLDSGKFVFADGLVPPNSVKVDGRRTADSLGGPVALFFGNIMGVEVFEPSLSAIASASSRDVALVLDISGSMGRSAGGGITRGQALVFAVDGFLNEIAQLSPGTNISLTTYSSSANRVVPLTGNMAEIRGAALGLRLGGGTNISQGILSGSNSLEQDANRRDFAERTIIVMTDGQFNVGGNPTSSARFAASRGHLIHSITFSDGANQSIMRQVADIGGGIHIHATSASDLSEAFRDIAKAVSVVLVN